MGVIIVVVVIVVVLVFVFVFGFDLLLVGRHLLLGLGFLLFRVGTCDFIVNVLLFIILRAGCFQAFRRRRFRIGGQGCRAFLLRATTRLLSVTKKMKQLTGRG